MITEKWQTESEGRFIHEAAVPGEKEAFLEFLITDQGKLVIKHTEVDESLGGQGIGKALLEHSFNYARSKGLKILPICPFAKNVMYSNLEQYRELL